MDNGRACDLFELRVKFVTALSMNTAAGYDKQKQEPHTTIFRCMLYLELPVLFLLNDVIQVWINLFQRGIELLWPLQGKGLEGQILA